jgi:predicted nucleic acid-binding protein
LTGFSLDTSVLSRLTKNSPDADYYWALLGEDTIRVSFQVRAEVLGAEFGSSRQHRLLLILESSLILPHSESTNIGYARTSRERRNLRRIHAPGSDAADGDVWVIASSLEHGLSLLSHDKQQIALARAMDLPAFTNLPGLRDVNPSIL